MSSASPPAPVTEEALGRMPSRWAVPSVRAALTIGFVGGLTTYSSFNYETMRMLAKSEYGPASVATSE